MLALSGRKTPTPRVIAARKGFFPTTTEQCGQAMVLRGDSRDGTALRFFSFESRWTRHPGLRARLSATRSTPDPERGNFVGSRPVLFRSGLIQGPGSLGAGRCRPILVRFGLSAVRGVPGPGSSETSLLRSGLHPVRCGPAAGRTRLRLERCGLTTVRWRFDPVRSQLGQVRT
jgi:hypothetical protein